MWNLTNQHTEHVPAHKEPEYNLNREKKIRKLMRKCKGQARKGSHTSSQAAAVSIRGSHKETQIRDSGYHPASRAARILVKASELLLTLANSIAVIFRFSF